MQLKPHNCGEDQLRVIPAVAKPREGTPGGQSQTAWGPMSALSAARLLETGELSLRRPP